MVSALRMGFQALIRPAGLARFFLLSVADSRLEFGSPVAGPARWFLDFEGTFETERTDDGTVVTHRELFSVKRPWRWLAEPLLRSWLENDTTEEMVRFKHLIERDDDAPASDQ